MPFEIIRSRKGSTSNNSGLKLSGGSGVLNFVICRDVAAQSGLTVGDCADVAIGHGPDFGLVQITRKPSGKRKVRPYNYKKPTTGDVIVSVPIGAVPGFSHTTKIPTQQIPYEAKVGEVIAFLPEVVAA